MPEVLLRFSDLNGQVAEWFRRVEIERYTSRGREAFVAGDKNWQMA
jgi:hypothetical protein